MAEGTSEYVEFNPAARLQLHHWRRIYPTEKTVDQTIGYGYNAVDLTTCRSHTFPESIYEQKHAEVVIAEGEVTVNTLLSGMSRTLMQKQNNETTRRSAEKKMHVNKLHDVVNPTRFLLTRGPSRSPTQICSSTTGT